MARFGVPTGRNIPARPSPVAFARRFFPQRAADGVVAAPAGAANNIAQTARVAPKTPNLTGIINSISTRINNQYQAAVQNIQNNVTNIVQPELNKLKADHTRKVIDAQGNKPTKLLGSFMSTLNSGLDFVRFLSDKGRLLSLTTGLLALKGSFNDIFAAGGSISSNLTRLAGQLLTLPALAVGGGGQQQGGGDNNVPQNRREPEAYSSEAYELPTEQHQGPTAPRPPVQPQEPLINRPTQQPETSGTPGVSGALEVPETIQPPRTLNDRLTQRFDETLNQFDRTLGTLTRLSTPREEEEKPSSSGATPQTDVMGRDQQEPSRAAAPSTTGSGSYQDTRNFGIKSNFAPILQDIFNSGKADPNTLRGRAAAGAFLSVAQMESDFPYERAYTSRGGTDNMMQGPVQLNRYVHPASAFQSKESYLNYTVPKFTGDDVSFTGASRFDPLKFAELLKNATTGWEVAQALRSSGFSHYDFDPLDTPEESNRLTPDQVIAIKKMVFGQVQGTPTQTEVTPTGTQVTPAPGAPAAYDQTATDVSQPARPGGTNVTVIPSGQPTRRPRSGGGGKSGSVNQVPFFPTSTSDNVHAMQAKLTYNIVD